jgi:hypothetical protein
MKRRQAIVTILSVIGTPALHAVGRAGRDEAAWTPLFNGKDLTGWETWLGKPHKTIDVPGQPRNDAGEYLGPLGLNVDPKGVYTVVQADGAPAIRVSGEVFGAVTTQREYENYQLRFEFKWGEKKWPMRADRARDSGCLYHCVGPHGAGSGFWMKSFEMQIQEGDCGDFWSVAGVMADVHGIVRDPADPKSDLIYKKGAPVLTAFDTTKRVAKDADYEKRSGEWNTVDIYCVGRTSVHMVNGHANLVLTNLRQNPDWTRENPGATPSDARVTPLAKGRIQFQSEGAEVFYRNIAVRPCSTLPAGV